MDPDDLEERASRAEQEFLETSDHALKTLRALREGELVLSDEDKVRYVHVWSWKFPQPATCALCGLTAFEAIAEARKWRLPDDFCLKAWDRGHTAKP
ncbi:MAG: hypothetical protein NTW87_30355 [Planctomycetota bacterium]|nr:hypothetical protein [Planctomycetota bacterium]